MRSYRWLSMRMSVYRHFPSCPCVLSCQLSFNGPMENVFLWAIHCLSIQPTPEPACDANVVIHAEAKHCGIQLRFTQFPAQVLHNGFLAIENGLMVRRNRNA